MRTLVVSIGNSTLFCGVFSGERLAASFRLPASAAGLGARLARRAGGKVEAAALCSVVPALTEAVASELTAGLATAPGVLTAAAPHGLKIGYRRPAELGTDRLAAALGARWRYPDQNVIVVDCGTATTVTALHRDGTLLGGAILPGLALWPEVLAARTAQLPRVTLGRPAAALGRSPREGIASGVYFGHAGAIRELIQRVGLEAFGRSGATVIGTGGSAPIFQGERLFTAMEPHLILHGLRAFISVLG